MHRMFFNNVQDIKSGNKFLEYWVSLSFQNYLLGGDMFTEAFTSYTEIDNFGLLYHLREFYLFSNFHPQNPPTSKAVNGDSLKWKFDIDY